MIIPPIRWGDSLTRTGDDIVIPLSPSQQYLLQMFTSLIQMNPSIYITDFLDYSEEDINQGLDELLNRVISDDMASLWKLGILPKLTGDMATVNTGGAMTYFGSTLLIGGGYWSHATPAINDKITYPFIALKKGEYDIRVYYTKEGTAGICTIKLNDVTTLLTIDAYAAAGVNNSSSQASFTIATDDIYYLTLKQSSKNVSSTGYKFGHNFVFLRRVSD